MKRNSIALVATLFVFTLGTTLAIAQPPRQGPRGDGPGRGPLFHCLQIVDLNEDQQAQVRSILEAAEPTLQALREDVREKKEAVRALMDGDVVVACEVGAAVITAHAAGETLRAEMQKVNDNIKLLLSPEQAAKLEGCLEAAGNDGPGRRGRMGGNGNGQGSGPCGN